MIAAFVIVIAAVSFADSPPALNNIGYLGYGYNQFTGNPQDDGFDPGLTVPVFNITIYMKEKTSSDRSFAIPDGVDAHRAPSCESESISKEILDENDLSSILQHSFEAHFIGVPFSANTKFQRIKRSCRENHDVFIDSVSTCEQYAARILMYNPPPFTNDFLSSVAKLPENYNEDNRDAFVSFLRNFGTHVVTKVWMGSRLIRTYRMIGSRFAELLGLGINIKLAATIHSGNAMGKFGINTVFNRSEELQSFLQQHLMLEDQIGTPQNASADFSDKWFPMRLNEPAPVRYSLTKISDLVGKEKQDAVEQAIIEFCKFIGAQCHPEESLPQPIPICPSVKFNLDKTKHTGPCTYGISVEQKTHPELVCPGNYILTGVQLSVGRIFGHLRFNIGCSTRFDISLEPADWISPVQTRADTGTSAVYCPKGHFATGVSFVRYCLPSSRLNTFASLQCSRSSQPIKQVSFTAWTSLPMPSSPLFIFLTCADGGIVCGIEFRGKKPESWSKQTYRLKCCHLGPTCVSRHPIQKPALKLPSLSSEESATIIDPTDAVEEHRLSTSRLPIGDMDESFFSARSQFDLGNVQFFSSRFPDLQNSLAELPEDAMEDAELPDSFFNGEIVIETSPSVVGWRTDD